MDGALIFVFYISVLVFSVIIHEVSHGYVAKALGDDTAEVAGRLTFNPVVHVSFLGSIVVPFLLYIAHLPGLAWAKPVPYNPYKLYKDFRYGPLKVALAGPASNIVVALVFGLLTRWSVGAVSPVSTILFALITSLNLLLAIFNLLPIPPLDGSRILPYILPRHYVRILETVNMFGFLFIFLFIYIFSDVIFYIVSHLFVLILGSHASGLVCARAPMFCP